MKGRIAKAGDLVCPYCVGVPVLVKGREIYPHRPDLWEKNFYLCVYCGAYVGCHPGTVTPLGRLADAELRAAKNAAHAIFDPLWKSGGMKRKAAYAWLADKLGIDRHDCHIGAFDIETCERVVAICGSEGGACMMSEESRELTRLRQDQEAAEAFKVGKNQPRRRYWVDPNQVREVDPRDRD